MAPTGGAAGGAGSPCSTPRAARCTPTAAARRSPPTRTCRSRAGRCGCSGGSRQAAEKSRNDLLAAALLAHLEPVGETCHRAETGAQAASLREQGGIDRPAVVMTVEHGDRDVVDRRAGVAPPPRQRQAAAAARRDV